MDAICRRKFLGQAAETSIAFLAGTAFPGAYGWSRSSRSPGIQVKEISFDFEDFHYRTPLKFGGTPVDQVTLLNVRCEIAEPAGKSAKGFGSMPLGNIWSFPSKNLSYQNTLGAMKSLAGRVAEITRQCKEYGHPIELNRLLEPEYLKAAEEISRTQQLVEAIPKLAVLVVASPFDAALHDAFGKMHGLSSYLTYGKDFLPFDLSHYLGPEFKGEHLDRYVLSRPKPRMPLYHLVGALDSLTDSDIRKRIDDGLPETLPEWIRYNGLTHIKIKLNGNDLSWDVERVLGVDRVTTQTQEQRGIQTWCYSLDFNEKCPHVQYLLDFLNQIKEKSPTGFARIQYIEQPTARDLKTHRQNVMQEASRLRPVVIDESLTDLESLRLAREMGYTGAALKACKGQSQALLMAAAAQKYKMFLCVQDLTCPGASLIHSAGLAAHIPGVAAIEANARQFVPAANKGWEDRFPGLFHITDGTMQTGILDKPGLSAVQA
jgi:L-alanine-DL-glutamate epimerase-like enolase superfamily enzyme